MARRAFHWSQVRPAIRVILRSSAAGYMVVEGCEGGVWLVDWLGGGVWGWYHGRLKIERKDREKQKLNTETNEYKIKKTLKQ